MKLPGDFALEQPAWLLAAVPAILLAHVLTRRLDLFPSRKLVLFVLRAATAAAIVLAAAGPVRLNPSVGPVIVFGIDASDSYAVCAGDPATLVAQALAEFSAPDDLRTAVIVFAGQPKLTRPPAPGLPSRAELIAAGVAPGATDLAAAVRLMRSISPGTSGLDVRFVLLTDGRATVGDVHAAAAGGPPIFPFAGGMVPSPDARVAALRVPDRATPGALIAGSVTVIANAAVKGRVRVDFFRTPFLGRPHMSIVEHMVELRPGLPEDVVFTHTLPEGVWTCAADFLPFGADAVAANNLLTATVTVSRGGGILLITGQPDGPVGKALRSLPGRTIRVRDNLRSIPGLDELIGVAPHQLAEFETIVLDDVPTDRALPAIRKSAPAQSLLNNDGVTALSTYVRDFGGGLLVLGGPTSFGPGGYHLSPINELLPVDSDPRSRNPIALAVVFDASGSMSRPISATDPRKRIEAAREAVSALRPPVLNPRDELCVIAFSNRAEVIRSLGDGTDWSGLAAKLRDVTPAGPTLFAPALEAAAAQLAGSRSTLRRIVLVSDGENDPAENAALTALAAKLREAKIRLSVVISGEPAKFLSELAVSTGGRFHDPQDFAQVPDRLLEDVMSAGEFVRDGPIAVRPAAIGPLTGLAALKNPPPLDRLLRTVLKPEASAAFVSDRDDPVATYRRVGLGRVVAVPTSLPDWAPAWKDGMSDVLRSILDWTMQPPAEPDFTLTADVNGPQVRFELMHVPPEGKLPANDLRPRLRVGRPGGAVGTSVVDVELRQTAPGRYTAWADLPEQGTYVAVVAVAGDAPRTLARATVTTGHPREITEIGFDEAALSRLAAATGGKLIHSLSDLTGWGSAAGYRQSLAAWALAAAFALASLELLLQIAVRKGWW